MARVRTWLSRSAALVAMSTFSAVHAAPSDDVKALVEQRQSAAAYAEGKKHPESFGDPAFDFYFGIAAIDSGHAGEGVLALERYLLNFPDNASARLHLARGYFLLSDDAQARAEFEALRKTNPSGDTVALIDRYLDAIRLRETRYSVSAGAYVELGVGHDTNVNAGPAAEDILLPGFGLQPLDPSSRKIADDFASVGMGGFVSYPVRPGVSLFANAQGERRYHHHEDDRQFELGNYNAAAGVSVVRGKNLFRLAVSYGLLTVGHSRYRSAQGAAAEWQHRLDAHQTVSFALQAAQLRYRDPNAPRDADFAGVAVTYKRLFVHEWQPLVTIGLNASRQRTRTEHPELVPRSSGANAAVTFAPHADWGVQVGYLYQRSDYQGPDFFAFPENRHDKYQAFNIGLSYLLTRQLSIRAEALSSRNRSNADAYAFPREVYAVKIRYENK